MRDMRDPQLLGTAYTAARKGGVPIEVAVLLQTPDYDSNQSCIDKYGSPDEVEPVYAEVRIK